VGEKERCGLWGEVERREVMSGEGDALDDSIEGKTRGGDGKEYGGRRTL